jgi:GTP-binding protein EngB required for normal cell division
METIVPDSPDKKILEHYFLEKQRINANIQKIEDFIPTVEADEEYQSFMISKFGEIVSDARNMNNNEYPIAVLANWNNGKSTFLNALIGEDILPMKNKSYTSEITTIKYGEEPKIITEFKDGEREETLLTESLTSNILIDYVTTDGTSLKDREIEQITIEYPLDICKEGIVLIDTPGVNSINDTHDTVTFSIIPNAKAIIMLVKSDSAGGKDDVEFLKRILPGRNPEEFDVIFVINKADTVNEQELEDAKESLENALATVTDNYGNLLLEKYKICTVSSYYELQYRLFRGGKLSIDNLLDDEKLFKARLHSEEDAEKLAGISKFNELKQVLNESFMGLDTTNQYIVSLDNKIECFASDVLNYLTRTKIILENDQDLNSLKEEQKRIMEVLKRTDYEKEEIIKEFELEFKNYGRLFDSGGERDWKALVKANIYQLIIETDWKELQKDEGKLISDWLKTEIQREYYKTDKYIDSFSETLVNRYKQRLISLVKDSDLAIEAVTKDTADNKLHLDGYDTQNVNFNSGMVIGGAAGAAAGATAGAVLGSIIPVIGTGIGAAIGGVIGLFPGGIMGGEGKAKEKLIGKVMPQIIEQIDKAYTKQLNAVDQSLIILKDELVFYFQSVIDEYRTGIEESYSKVMQTKKLKEDEIVKVTEALETNIDELRDIIINLEPIENEKKAEEPSHDLDKSV